MNTRKHKEVLDNFIEIYERVMPTVEEKLRGVKSDLDYADSVDVDFYNDGVPAGIEVYIESKNYFCLEKIPMSYFKANEEDYHLLTRNLRRRRPNELFFHKKLYNKAKTLRDSLCLGYKADDGEDKQTLIDCIKPDLEERIIKAGEHDIKTVKELHKENLKLIDVMERYQRSGCSHDSPDHKEVVASDEFFSSIPTIAVVAALAFAVVGFVIALNK